MRALITGITGFIGSHVAEFLISQGDQVCGVSRSGQWRDCVPPTLAANCSLRAWDIAAPATDALLSDVQNFAPDVVFHFAGLSIPSQCGKDSPTPQAIATNVGGTRHVLDLVQRLNSPARLVFASTVHVYARVNPDNPYVDEESAIAPISAYGKTKRECESAILDRMQIGKLEACIARGFHHIGPRQPQGLMLTDWLGQLSDPDCARLKVRATNSYLDLIDVRDAAVAYRLLAENTRACGIYNLGSGRISRSGDVLQTILAQLGRQVDVIESSPAEQWNAIADIGKLSSFGWQPKFTYHDTITSMIAERT